MGGVVDRFRVVMFPVITGATGERIYDGYPDIALETRPRLARRVDDYGPTTALLAQLDVTHADGTTASFGTDGTWRSAPSHILGADLVAGEVHDLRRRRDWRDRASWAPVRVEDHGYAELVEPVAPPVRRVEELRPASVTRLRPGCWVVDVGQNVNGWVRLGRLGPAGTAVTLTAGSGSTATAT